MRALRRASGAVLALAVATLGAACSGPQDPGSQSPRPAGNQIRLYGSDANMLNSVGDQIKDNPQALAGMKGTAPLTPLSEGFKQRLRTIDPQLKDYVYAGESYDAVVISALAAEVAHSTDSANIAAQINGVTVGGTDCETPRDCLTLIHNGKDIAYRGISLHLGGFTDDGEPSTGTYGILRFRAGNHLDDGETEFVPTGDASDATQKAPAAPRGNGGDGPLRVGGLLPHTGDAAASGPPMFAGARLGIAEINEAGGVLGRDVLWFDSDDGTDEAVARANAQKLVNQGVQVIIGTGAGSSITMAVLPDMVAAGVVMISPSNTADELSSVQDKGLFFRTAPPDVLQATALADLIMRDGVRRLYIVARDDSYGLGLMNGVKANLLKAGVIGSDIFTWTYKPDEPDFTKLGAGVKSFAPDGVLIIGFDESAEAITAIESSGLSSRAL